MGTEHCVQRKNEMKKYIRKEATKEIWIDIDEEWKRKFV